ncbi:FtsX-like permease family protein [Candidatus Izemoplasma sp. B36]|uniref:FtsX-like permease family protein n=1 Tax=Candidatus Izemoplasma sp. B36 TaxID=3242468 RepID=UPI0035589736
MILLFSMHHTFSKIYEYQASNIYQNTDIVIDYDEYSSARLINERNLQEDYGEYFDEILCFFNINLLTETNGQRYYSQMFSSKDYEFERLIDQDVDLKDNEVIITKAYAEAYNLNIGDDFNFYILDKSFNYTIKQIYPEYGVFEGNSFFVNKEVILDELYGLGDFSNFGNTVYLDVNDNYDLNEVFNILDNSDDYGDYHIFLTIDWEYINSKAMDNISMFLSLGLVVLLAILMVLDSLFPIVNKNLKQNLGVINTLGGESKIILEVSLLQWLMYIFVSLIIGLILSGFVINYGIYMYGLRGFIYVGILPIILSLITVIVFVEIRAYISFRKINSESIASKSKDKRFNIYKIQIPIFIIALLALIIELYFKFFSLAVHSLIIVILSLYVALNLSSIFLIGLSKLLKKIKSKSVFSLFQTKHLISNKHIHQSLRVLFISLISIVLVFSVRSYLYEEIDKFYNVMDFDLAVTNINDYDEELLQEINNYDVSSIDEGIIYSDVNVYFNEVEYQPSKYFISMDIDNISNYVGIDIIKYNDQYITDTKPIVILPKNFELVYGLNIGDTVTLNLNYKLRDIEMIVAGYFDTNFDNFIYSNIYEKDIYQDEAKINTVFINSEDKTDIYDDLIIDYSEKMYFVIDPDSYFDELVEGVEKVTNYFSVFTAFLILCFVIVIFNNTLLVFFDIKSDLVKVKVLGASKKDFMCMLLLEFVILLLIIISVGLVEILILSNHLKGIVLLINYYKDISAYTNAVIIGFVLSSVVLLLSYWYYYKQIMKIKMIDEIKFY